MDDLTVVSVICNNANGILPLMLDSVEIFSPAGIKVILCNTNQNFICPYSSKNIEVINFKPRFSGGSNIHGEALNFALSKVKSNRVAVVESDCVLLNHQWYKSNRPFKFAKKGEGLFHICFMVGQTDRLRKVDFRPGTDRTRKSGKSYAPGQDVGWRLRDYINTNEVTLMENIDCKTGKGKVFGPGFQSDEIWDNGIPVVAHYGRGSNLGGKAKRSGFKDNKVQLKEWLKVISEALCENK